jgi:hypothetical protein
MFCAEKVTKLPDLTVAFVARRPQAIYNVIFLYFLCREVEKISRYLPFKHNLCVGMCGGPTGAIAAWFSYIAVVSDEGSRTTRQSDLYPLNTRIVN